MPPAASSTVERVQLTVVRHLSRARRALRQPTLDDHAIHEARKDLKRARSGLRLLRPLDESAYVRENMRLRDAARRLSSVRDAKVLLARIAKLLEDEKKPERRAPLVALRKDLRNARRRDWRALRSDKRIERIEGSLAVAASHVRDWRTAPEAGVAPAYAVRRLYRKGRKALERSQKDPTDERLHEARKQAKHLAQALEILAGKKPKKKARKVLSRANDVGDWLGDDHDLAVVESRLVAHPAADEKSKKKLHSRLDKERARLQKKALKAADKLFRRKTKRVLARAAGRVPLSDPA
jgi:CHAD domain-containing protein